MNIKLKRYSFTDNSTIGELYIDKEFQCYTLEPTVRPKKIKGKTAIDAGTYEVIINWSNRFKRNLPLLLKVPNFEGVRIHIGNTPKDTAGCILVGKTVSKDMLGNSRLAFEALFAKMEIASKKEKIILTIE